MRGSFGFDFGDDLGAENENDLKKNMWDELTLAVRGSESREVGISAYIPSDGFGDRFCSCVDIV